MSESSPSPFPSTHWTMVARAGASDSERLAVLGKLLEKYVPPMRSYLVARFGLPPERTDDLLQSFLADKILDQDIIRQADRTRGKFRTFLIRALDRFVINRLRDEKAAGRFPAAGHAPLDDGEALDHPAPATRDVFDVAWGRQVIELALVQMRRECEAGGRQDLWAVFEGRVLGPTLRGDDPVPLAHFTSELGVTAAKASNLLVTAKRMFARTLREVVRRYAVDEQDTEDEIRWLRQILSRSGA